MARRTKRLRHRRRRPRQHVRASTHRTADKYRLAAKGVVDGDERVVRRQRACRALAVHEQRARRAVHHVLLHLGDIVGYVVHDAHLQLVRRAVELSRKRLPAQEGHRRAIDPRVVGRRRHRRQVVLPLVGMDARARELPVVGGDAVTRHRLLHRHQRVRRHLVAEAAAARVQQHAHLPLPLDPHRRRRALVEDALDHLHLGVVVARAERAQLRQPALLRARRHRLRPCRQHPAALLAVLLVLCPRVALTHRPVHPELERLLQRER
mmetsp:Transcript_2542/g.5233  ORF Transcript_2542/g.5233 Transcript_2542/m.5233 type:complete len:265 (-) Transcript_2542:336-1130(-)